jgi:thioredoxin 1
MKNTFLIIAAAAFATMAFTWQGTAATVEKATVKAAYSGIKFDHIRVEKAMAQAKSSGKLIFIDVHTTWCGPCKEMARTTFQSDEVGKVFNKKFINLKIDAENDPDGADISRTYGVNAYPTLLFINAEGKLVKKLVGKQSEEKLLAIANGL